MELGGRAEGSRWLLKGRPRRSSHLLPSRHLTAVPFQTPGWQGEKGRCCSQSSYPCRQCHQWRPCTGRVRPGNTARLSVLPYMLVVGLVHCQERALWGGHSKMAVCQISVLVPARQRLKSSCSQKFSTTFRTLSAHEIIPSTCVARRLRSRHRSHRRPTPPVICGGGVP